MNECKTDLVFYTAAIDDDICHVSDHLPILALINCEIVNKCDNFSPHVAWNKCTEEHFDLYKYSLDQELEHIKVQEPRTDSEVNQ